MNVEDIIKSYEKKQEIKIEKALEEAESQRYWEQPLIREKPSVRHWEEPLGTDKAIWEWRRQFPCLRIRGHAIFPSESDEAEVEEEWSDNSSENFWSQSCEVDPFAEDELPPPEAETWRIVFDNDALDESAIFSKKKKLIPPPPPEDEFQPNLQALSVVGIRPAHRTSRLPEEEIEEVLAIHGNFSDFIAVSAWNEAPPPDPESLFPPPVPPLHLSQDDATNNRRESAHALLILETYMQAAASGNSRCPNIVTVMELENFFDKEPPLPEDIELNQAAAFLQ